MTYFVPKYLGFQHISREDFTKEHTRPHVQEVPAGRENVAAVVLDGTYINIEKLLTIDFRGMHLVDINIDRLLNS